MLLIDKVPSENLLTVVIPLTDEFNLTALKLSSLMRERGMKTELLLKAGSLKSKMKLANRFGARFVVFVSERPELKDMETGEQEVFETAEDIVDVLEKRVLV